MKLTPEEILRVKTKGVLNIVEGSPLHKAVISAMNYYAKQEAENEVLRKHEVVGRSEQFTCSCGIPPAIRLCEGVESCLKCGENLSK